MESLPTITPEFPGCGGHLKAEPSHFIVEELPLYVPGGSGPHLYVSLTREGWTTRQVVDALAHLYGIHPRDVGYAGLKDRHARCTQAFSLPSLDAEDAERIEQALPFQVHWARRHTNKLKVGHLLGNRFRIRITGLDVPVEEALDRSRAIAAAIARRGVPNFYGAQRFGIGGANVAKGREVVLGRGPHRDRWLQRLLVSAYQSHLFNVYLGRRIALGLFDRLLRGDIAKKADTGGMFQVTDAAQDQPRYQRGEIHFTGPIYGKKMWAAQDAAGDLEAGVLADAGLTLEDFRRARTDGTRRPARLWLPEIGLAPGEDCLDLDFCLPKGAYATVVLREFTKVEPAADLFDDDSED